MKKLIGALALAAMVATSAFAEVSFGAWICNLPTLVAYDGEDVKSGGVANPWGGWRPVRFSTSWTADDGKAGMTMGVSIENGAIGTFAPNAFWIKPIDQIKVHVGHFDDSFGLRSDLCFGSWDWLRPNNAVAWGEGITFSAYDFAGFAVQLFPVEGLNILLGMPMTTSADDAYKAFGQGKVAAAYTIDGIGTIKVGFNGEYKVNAAKAAVTANAGVTKDNYYYVAKNGTVTEDANYSTVYSAAMDDQATATPTGIEKAAKDLTVADLSVAAADESKKYGTIEAAFDLTGIDKLFVTIGGAFTIADSDWFKAAGKDGGPQIKFALGASYGITEAFKLSADFAFAKYHSDVLDDPVMSFGVGANYALTEALGIVGDVRMLLPNNNADPTLSFLVGLNGAVGSNASLGVGFQGIVGLGDKASTDYGLQVVKPTAADKFAFAVPVRASFWF